MFGGYLFLIIEDYIWQLNRCDLAGSLRQRAEAAASGDRGRLGAGAAGNQGRALAGDLRGLQCAGGGVGGGGVGGKLIHTQGLSPLAEQLIQSGLTLLYLVCCQILVALAHLR